MSPLRKLLLLAVLAAFATAGLAPTASATTRVTCGTGITCANGATFNGHSTGSTITMNLGNVSCSTSSIVGKINGLNPNSTTVPIQITGMSFSACTAPPPCSGTWAVVGLPYNGTVSTSLFTISNWTVSNVCGCTFNASTVTGNLSGSTITFSAQITVTSACQVGGGVGSFAVWHATYVLRTGSTVGSGSLVTVDSA